MYAPLWRRRWLLAVVLSNLVGLTLDSVVFLSRAFGSLEFLLVQIVRKAWMTALTVGVYALWLGIHHPGWLAKTAVPLFVSRRRLALRRRLPRDRLDDTTGRNLYATAALAR